MPRNPPNRESLTKTPNKWHYMPVVARITPHGFHRFYNRLRGRKGEDTFPTRYRANTARRLRELSEGAGLEVERLERFETEPEYLAFHLLPYALGVAYERLVNRFGWLSRIRVNLLLVGRKA